MALSSQPALAEAVAKQAGSELKQALDQFKSTPAVNQKSVAQLEQLAQKFAGDPLCSGIVAAEKSRGGWKPK